MKSRHIICLKILVQFFLFIYKTFNISLRKTQVLRRDSDFFEVKLQICCDFYKHLFIFTSVNLVAFYLLCFDKVVRFLRFSVGFFGVQLYSSYLVFLIGFNALSRTLSSLF